MPTPRRAKLALLLAIVAVIALLYVTSAARQTRDSAFYTRTQDALATTQQQQQQQGSEQRAAADEDAAVRARLREAESKAKEAADKKDRKFQQEVMGPEHDEITGEKAVAGRVMMKDKDDGVAKVGNVGDGVVVGTRPSQAAGPAAEEEEQGPMTEEEREAELELNAILKKSPIIIFSKTFCPFSKKAKAILTEQYKITPAPYVVELDTHPLGTQLQAALAKGTGRRTVPNVLINGKSIGGGDDVEALHEGGELVSTITGMGGKRIVEARLVSQKVRRNLPR